MHRRLRATADDGDGRERTICIPAGDATLLPSLSGSPTYILGISAFFHDSAACLLRDGEIVAAAQEERFTRRKGDAGFPARAVAYCLAEAGIEPARLDAVGFYDKPLLKFDRLLETYLAIAPRGFRSFLSAAPVWAAEKLFTDAQIRDALGGFGGDVLYAEHHESHAASAFYPSPFGEAAILTVDGVGEWATASIGRGRGRDIELLREMQWPDSLGLLYSAFTQYLGFRVNSGEYKVMGLAPYGDPIHAQTILDELVSLRDDGSFALDQRYFDYVGGLSMTSPAFHDLFGGPPREPESALTRREMDLACSVQHVCEEIMLRMVRTAHTLTGLDALCLAGGVALNAVANGRILREGPFRELWIQPAAGDAGGAIGVAQLIWHRHLARPRSVPALARGASSGTRRDGMHGALLGPAFSAGEIERSLDALGAPFIRMSREELLDRVAELLAAEQVIGWFHGRMELGPRALGSRSILADARSPTMRARLNEAIKLREHFRPFAPSILRERSADWFELGGESPYMALVVPLLKARRGATAVPAVVHVDDSARLQTVDRETSPDFHALLERFERRTGCPMLVNTSFNVRGEPIVLSPGDAYRCFMRTGIDHLVLWPFLLDRRAQPALAEASPWTMELD